MTWDFGSEDKAIAQTNVELYWILAKPQSMWPDGVWIQLLRDIFAVLGSSQEDLQNIIQALVQTCFDGFTPDSLCGIEKTTKQYALGSSYLITAFALWNYYQNIPIRGSNYPHGTNCQDTDPINNGVNCQDQTAFVQLTLGAIGIETLTGTCNFLPAAPLEPTLSVIIADQNTQLVPGVPVSNYAGCNWGTGHMFAALASNLQILDATIGPVLGTWSLQEYLQQMFTQQANVQNAQISQTPPGFTVVCTQINP